MKTWLGFSDLTLNFKVTGKNVKYEHVWRGSSVFSEKQY